jgi:putative colanic acid biosynthesis acetyltransferase WcaF
MRKLQLLKAGRVSTSGTGYCVPFGMFAGFSSLPGHRRRCIWRRCLLRLFGAKISPTARIYGSTTVWYPPNLEMGEHAMIGWRTLCYSMDRVVIGDYAIVSQCSFLLAGTHDIDDPNFQLQTKPIHIKRRAWVAACAIVGPGVTIGEGAVLGGGGVAFKDLEPWTVYAGNPARRVRARKRGETGTGS